VRTAQRLGINSALKANESLALGTSEVTPLELTGAYAVLANGGTGVVPHVILEVKTTAGQVIYRRPAPALGQVVDPAHIGMMNRMMRETLVSGTARKSDLPGHPAAGKTGTTQDHRDAWFVGYTGQLVATVWVGNDDSQPMKKVTGSGLPAEIWADFMRQAHRGLPSQPLPGARDADPLSGLLQAAIGPSTPPAAVQESPGAWQQQGPSARDRSLLSRLFGQ